MRLRFSPGQCFLLFLGLLIAFIGAIFIYLMSRSYLRAKDMRHWVSTPCTILSADTQTRQIDPSSPAEYRFRISYGYEFQNQRYSSERYSLRGTAWTSSEEKLTPLLEKFPLGDNVCYVNPKQPNIAVLRLDSLAPGYSLWFPALFVIGGLGISGGIFWKRN